MFVWFFFFFFFSSRRRHTRLTCDWSSDVCSSDLANDRVALAWGVDLDPRLAEVDGPVRVVGRDLDQGDLGGLVDRMAPPGLRHLDRVQIDPAGTDTADALDGLRDAQLVARRM